MIEYTPYCIEDRSDALSPGELEACVVLLERGAAVDPISARRELPLAHARIVATLDGAIVGVGAIKRARAWYANKNSVSSGYAIDPNTLELGYVTIADAHRGHRLSSRIVDALLLKPWGALYATTDKDEMKTLLSNRLFVKQGREWDGTVGCLSLWIRPARESEGP